MHTLKFNLKKYELQQFFVVLFTILLSKTLYFESLGTNMLLIPFVLFLLLILYKSITNIHLTKILTLYILLLVFSVSINPESNIRSVLVLYLITLINILLINYMNFRTFTRYFSKIITILALFSWLSWIIIYFNISSLLPDLIAINAHHFRNFVFLGVMDTLVQYQSFRAASIWWEPGVFQVFLNLAFIFNLIYNRMSLKKYFIFLVSIIFIQSTTGAIVFLLLSVIYLKRNFKITKQNLLILTVLMLVLLLILSSYVFPIITEKFNIDGNSFYSFLSRYYDVKISISAFFDNIFLGYGYGSQIKNIIPYGTNLIGYDIYNSLAQPTGSDGITMFISQMGILSFFLLQPLLFPKYIRHLSIFEKIIISLSIFILFNTENFTFKLIFTLLSVYGIIGNTDLNKSNKHRNKNIIKNKPTKDMKK